MTKNSGHSHFYLWFVSGSWWPAFKLNPFTSINHFKIILILTFLILFVSTLLQYFWLLTSCDHCKEACRYVHDQAPFCYCCNNLKRAPPFVKALWEKCWVFSYTDCKIWKSLVWTVDSALILGPTCVSGWLSVLSQRRNIIFPLQLFQIIKNEISHLES